MGKIIDALRRGAENGGRKTTVGGDMVAEYAETKEDHLFIAKNDGKLSERGVKKK
jgi:hypothetical protein